MAHLATPPGFGTNKFPEQFWARFGAMTSDFMVADAASWKPTVGVGTRAIAIAPGKATASGIYDETDATETLTFAANGGSSDRYDALVASFNWATKAVTFKVIQGGASAPAVNTGTSVNESQINRIPGLRYDAVIGIQKVRPGVTTFINSDISDRRVWPEGVAASDWTAFPSSAAASGWEFELMQGSGGKPSAYKGRGEDVGVRARLRRTGGTLTPASDGNIGDLTIIDEGMPELATGISHYFAGQKVGTAGVHLRLNDNGTVDLVAFANSNVRIDNGDRISFSFTTY